MNVGHGWLARHPGPWPPIEGFTVNHEVYPTRWEEYQFVTSLFADKPSWAIVDAGAGFDPVIHFLPQMLARQGHSVEAVDNAKESLDMPPEPGVHRRVCSMTAIPAMNHTFDAWVCVSVLEHVPESVQREAMAEAVRVTKPGGYVVLTADLMPLTWYQEMAKTHGLDIGREQPFLGDHLVPRVSWCVGRVPIGR